MTEHEANYVSQGWIPPAGLGWDAIAEARKRWGIADYLVPVARANGIAWGWGVPIINGKFLKH